VSGSDVTDEGGELTQSRTDRSIYEGILTSLEEVGLHMKEGIHRGASLESHLVRSLSDGK
jgi:hypothetical protein